MAFTKYVTQFKDKDDNVYGVMDEECRLSLQNGTHEDLTAGNALFLLSDRGETDKEPYVFRKTGGSKNAYGREMLKKIVGGTVAWNQLAKALNSTNWSPQNNAQVSYLDGVCTITPTQQYGRIQQYFTYVAGHKILIMADVKLSNSTGARNVKVSAYGLDTFDSGSIMCAETTDWQRVAVICHTSSSSSSNRIMVTDERASDWGTIQVKNYQLFDLTQMFGATIADNVDIAWFRSLFPKSYYAYDAGTLMSVNAESHKLTGFNQWDGEYTAKTWLSDYTTGATANQYGYNLTSYIHVIPGTVYYKTATNSSRYGFYDANKNYIPQNSWGNSSATTLTTPNNAHYVRFTLTDVDLSTFCFNLSDTSKDGTYEPYQLRSYPLANVELRGVPKWVDGQMVFDGDEYTPDGTVKRRYGIVDLGTLTWKDNGTDNVYASLSEKKTGSENNTIAGLTRVSSSTAVSDMPYNTFKAISGSKNIAVKISGIDTNNAATMLSGVYLVYELETPTTESADPYRELQISNRNGTEEFTDRAEEAGSRDVAIPVGTETFYPKSIWDYVDEKVAELQALILES